MNTEIFRYGIVEYYTFQVLLFFLVLGFFSWLQAPTRAEIRREEERIDNFATQVKLLFDESEEMQLEEALIELSQEAVEPEEESLVPRLASSEELSSYVDSLTRRSIRPVCRELGIKQTVTATVKDEKRKKDKSLEQLRAEVRRVLRQRLETSHPATLERTA